MEDGSDSVSVDAKKLYFTNLDSFEGLLGLPPFMSGLYTYAITSDNFNTVELKDCSTKTSITSASIPITVTNGGFTNRSYTVTGDADLGVVCYNSCSACAYDVSFQVDMSQYTGTPFTTGVFMNGSFNGWNGTSNPMTDANMDGIWDITLSLPNGAMEYKFTLDGWNGQEQFVGGETCTITTGGFTNRFYTVAGAANVGVVCYNSCAACVVGGINELTSSAVEVYPNPTSGVMTVVSNASAPLSNITNIMGETVIALNGNESNINIESLNAGIYFLNFQVNGENQTIRIIRD